MAKTEGSIEYWSLTSGNVSRMAFIRVAKSRAQYWGISTLPKKDSNGVFSATLGILPNGEYLIDARVTSLYENVEVHTDISKFSIGGN